MHLSKPIGVGIYSAAIKKDALSQGGYAEMIATTTLLNKIGADLGRDGDVHAVTDVTGFGLLGMRERAQLLHGAVQITSSPGHGTIVTASFPSERRPAAATATPRVIRRTATS